MSTFDFRVLCLLPAQFGFNINSRKAAIAIDSGLNFYFAELVRITNELAHCFLAKMTEFVLRDFQDSNVVVT